MPRCSGEDCGAEVQFLKCWPPGTLRPNRKKRAMCLDLDDAVTQEGEVRWVAFAEFPTLTSLWFVRRAKVGERGVLDHHATCPNAGDFR